MLIILVRGIGDIGSAVAHRLFQAGYAVVIHDSLHPAASRRGMAFTDAIFDGSAEVDGVRAVRVDDTQTLPTILAAREVIPVVVTDLAEVLDMIHPQVLVDARMRKHEQPEIQRELAPLTIGLGPNFTAGVTTNLAVETSWGEDLGKILTQGTTRPLEGEPQPIAGHARDRYVYAPAAGVFHTPMHISDSIQAGAIIAYIDSTPITAPLDGVLRGLTRDGVPVAIGTKIIEVDPRGTTGVVTGIGERPRRIAVGVLEAVHTWSKQGSKAM